MLYFKWIKYKNFLSTGNYWTTIELNRSKTTLIAGENGAGKSTILDAISFCLFNKSFRGINKPQLINSVTGKNMVTECEFDVGKNTYRIVRGMKPTVFEIYVNDQLIDQTAADTDYQEYLETQILKINHKSFCRIFVLGSANFVPFMQLNPQQRRELIEDLLDIKIFSIMNALLKKRMSDNKDALKDIEYQISLTESKIDMHRKHIEALQQNNQELIDQKKKLIEKHTKEMGAILHKVKDADEASNKVEEKLLEKKDLEEKLTRLTTIKRKAQSKVSKIKEEIKFYQENDNCPTCKQKIDALFKNTTIGEKTKTLSDLEDGLTKLEHRQTQIQEKITSYGDVEGELQKYKDEITRYDTQYQSVVAIVKSLQKEIGVLESKKEVITESGDEGGLATELEEHRQTKANLLVQKEIQQHASVLLKDGGIKAKIVKQYVPIINKLINKYLQSMEFYINFELDEKFSEKINSRYYGDYTYESFSEGEKMRIDLALLFTWRAVARLRNSASTNLLILDEIMDSSLDANGTEEFLKIVNNLTNDTNVFIISHKTDQISDKFADVLKFEKHKGFSRIAA